MIPPSLQNTMQWFAVTLLNGRLPYLKPSETPILVETTEDDLLLTFAASDVSRILNSTVMRHRKVEVFGDPWDLVTVKWVEFRAANDQLAMFSQSRSRPLLGLKAPTSAFTFKTLLRHYAKRALTPRSSTWLA